jgi:hypothetical protein
MGRHGGSAPAAGATDQPGVDLLPAAAFQLAGERHVAVRHRRTLRQEDDPLDFRPLKEVVALLRHQERERCQRIAAAARLRLDERLLDKRPRLLVRGFVTMFAAQPGVVRGKRKSRTPDLNGPAFGRSTLSEPLAGKPERMAASGSVPTPQAGS